MVELIRNKLDGIHYIIQPIVFGTIIMQNSVFDLNDNQNYFK